MIVWGIRQASLQPGSEIRWPTLGSGGVVVTKKTDTHDLPDVYFEDIEDLTPKRLQEAKDRKDELHADILRAFEDVTGLSEIPTVERIEEIQKERPAERRVLSRIKEQVIDYDEMARHILRLQKQLQDQEMNDIAFIVSIL